MEEKKVFLEKYVFTSWALVLVLAIIIFYLSSLSLKGTGAGTDIFSIFYHFFAFFWLAFFLSAALVRYSRVNMIIPSIFISLFYAISDEIHQLYVPFRSCSLSDFLVDSFGILFASLIYLMTLRIRKS